VQDIQKGNSGVQASPGAGKSEVSTQPTI
jgi:hypothetical protein